MARPVTEQEVERRLAELEARLGEIDRHGTRGMEGVRIQLGQVQRDLGRVESSTDRTETALAAVQLQLAGMKPARVWPQLVGYLALLLPIYALVIGLLTGR